MSTSTQVTSNVSNAEGTAVATGTIVRISAANAALRAQADAPANVAGTIGVALAGANPGVSYPCVVSGEASTLLEAGLTLLPGQSIYVSATQPGRGTNVAPLTNAVLIGTIKNTTGYATTGRALVVVSTVAPAAAAPAPTGPIQIISGSFDLNGGNTGSLSGFVRISTDSPAVIAGGRFGPLRACEVKNFKVWAGVGSFGAATVRFDNELANVNLAVLDPYSEDLVSVLPFTGNLGNFLLRVQLISQNNLDAVLNWSCEVHPAA